MDAYRWGGEEKPLLFIMAMEEEGGFGALLGPGEQGWGTSPPFCLLEGGFLGNGSEQQDHPLSQLGVLGEIMTHGGEERERGGLAESPCCGRAGLSILYPWLWGLTERLVGLLSMEMDKRSAGWPVEDGSPSKWGQRVREELGEPGRRWWERGNTDAYLLTAACQERESSTPSSHLKSQATSSDCILCWLKPSWTSVKSSILSWRAWWYSSPAPWAGHGEEASRGAGQVPRVHREEATEPTMRTSASQRELPSQKSTMWNTADPLVLTSWTHSKPLSSPGTNHCHALFNREKRDFKQGCINLFILIMGLVIIYCVPEVLPLKGA